MIKKIITVLLIITISGGSLAFIGMMSSGFNTLYYDNDIEYTNEGINNLEAFKNIEIEVANADIKIVKGSEFKIEYSLNEKEKILENKIDNNTLIFKTKVKRRFNMNFDNHNYITITILDDSDLEKIKINNVSGEILLKDLYIEETDLETVSGDVIVDSCMIEELDIENVSGDVEINGIFNETSINTVSGKIDVVGELKDEAYLKSVSGDIHTNLNETSIKAESIGKVYFNGDNQGKDYRSTINEIMLEINSVSGQITIN